MKKNSKLLFPIIFAILVTVSVMSVIKVFDIRDYSKLINYVGIVRGASQRVVKLETNDHPSEELIGYIDKILEELSTGEGEFGLVSANCEPYRQNLTLLTAQWDLVKEEIIAVRDGSSKQELLNSSEELFDIANQTVFSIENFSKESADRVSRLIIITASICGVAFAVAMYYYLKRFWALKNTNEQLEKIAGKDELTGAYNMERFYLEVNRILEQNEHKKYAVLCVDFDNFRYVNDIFGYDYGDDILRSYAQGLMNRLASDELLGRVMADRFMVFRCYENKDDVLAFQKEWDKTFLDSLAEDSHRHLMTIACGICCREDLIENGTAEIMVERAGFVQKVAKKMHGSKYAFYGEGIRQKLFKEMALRDRMQKGLDEKEFVVYMQPKVGVMDEKIKGAEALIRWNIPGQGMLSPGLFIPVLEKNHFIGKVDRFVFEEVCRWLRKRLDNQEEVVPISVNVSKIQFYTPDFISVYAGIKNYYKIPDGILEIELTESAAFDHQEYLAQMVSELHENGFLCSLDDFGSGYSSLGMLKDLSIDVLKLDGMFFRTSVNIQREHTIIKSIIKMLGELHICTVAEGVEHEEQVEFLKTTGCDLIQGFFYYKPMEIEEFERLMDDMKKIY